MFRWRGEVVVIGVLLTLPTCTPRESSGVSGDAGQAGRGRQDAVPVVTAAVEVKPMPVTLGAVGTVEAISSVQVRSQVTGQLRVVAFTAGQVVKKGQLLFDLDARPFDAALRQAQATLEKDTAQTSAAREQRTRAQNLFERGILAKNDLETQAAAAASLEATLAADQAQVDEAKLSLQYARIVAPMDGRTGELTIHPGDLVRANDDTPLITINQLAPIYVTFSVPARFLAEIRHFSSNAPLKVFVTPTAGGPSALRPSPQQTAVSTTLPADEGPQGPSRPEGTVSFIDNAVDASTATIKLKATFANQDLSLWPGLFVQVSLQLSTEPRAIVVPAGALQASQQGSYVYVVKPDSTVEMRQVSLDRQQGNEAVIAKGLSGGETVVTDGQLRLTPGVRVTTQKAAAGASS